MADPGARLSRAFPVIVSGPSGVGKSTIVERLLDGDPGLRLAVSMTTRAPRPGEAEARDYFFVERADFEAGVERGEFVEFAKVHDELYGTPRTELDDWLSRGVDVLLDVDYQGGLAIKRAYADAVAIFILPPSLAHLERRLRGRQSDGEQQIQRRLEAATREMEQSVHYDYVVINDAIDQASALARAIVASERQRVRRMEASALQEIARPGRSTIDACEDKRG